MDRLFAAYAALSGIALLFPHHAPGWIPLLLLHALVVAAGFRAPPFARVWRWAARRGPRVVRVLGDWYPLALVPPLYAELAVLNRSVWGGRYFDAFVQRLEVGIFGEQPSHAWAQAHPVLPLSEALHAAYLSYYVIIYGPPLLLYLRGRRDDFRRGLFALMLAFFAHYLFFIYLPVQGPRYLFPAPDGALAGGFFYRLAHHVLQVGSSRGAAFPSSHVGVSVAQTIIMAGYLPWLAPFLGLLTIGLAAGAVYGGFHYATDALAGALLGIVAVVAAPQLAKVLTRAGRPREGR